MAHNTIELPAEIDLRCQQAAWTAGIAKYVGWKDSNIVAPEGVLRVIEPPQYAKLIQPVSRWLLPLDLQARVPVESSPGRSSRKIHKDPQSTPIEVIFCDVRTTAKGLDTVPSTRVDGWQMREDFLRLDHRTDVLLNFLNQYGVWHPSTTPNLYWRSVSVDPKIVLPDAIWYMSRPYYFFTSPGKYLQSRVDVQDTFRKALTSGGEKWFDDELSRLGELNPRPKFPHFLIKAKTCFDVIRTTITIDHLRGTRFSTCARHDCEMPFAIESRHRKLYCQQYCAHLESVRRNRTNARKEK